MKLKLLLLFLIVTPGIVSAQEVYRSLIFSEVRWDRNENSYIELTNVGDKDVMLSDYRLNYLSSNDLPFTSAADARLQLPEQILKPGESFVVACVQVNNFRNILREPHLHYVNTKPEMFEVADLMLDKNVSPGHGVLSKLYQYGDGFFLEQFVTEEDSIVVDQVGGVFDGEDGTNGASSYDVAGVPHANREVILVRKYNVKIGNLDFNSARGVDIEDSEWIPVYFSYNPTAAGAISAVEGWRKLFWTIGNHGDYNLNETTLVSETAEINWDNKTITVPWGVRNLDNFMNVFKKQEGLAWCYHLSAAREDSAYCSARTGDRITIYACGNDLDVETFDIIVNEPTTDANIVLPKYAPGSDGFFPVSINSGNGEVFMVTEGIAEMDTIFDVGLVGIVFEDSIHSVLSGLTYATHVDSLMKYLEKPSNAEWEIEWADGIESTVLKNGDKLKVTAADNSVKYYYIKIRDHEPSHVATLSSITWPDIPEFYKGIFGWKGDTIPGFSSNVSNYSVEVPLGVDGIPALVAKATNLNARIDVKRAKSLRGTPEDRTATFTVTAEDDTTILVYNVRMSKEKDPDNKQPFIAKPFISEVVHHEQFQNDFIEICNPGTEPLDMSNYIIVRVGDTNPAEAIMGHSGPDQWLDRYRKYVPGYKYADEATWSVNPGILQRDLAVSPIVDPGDVFVIGHVHNTMFVDRSPTYQGYPWFASEACDIEFNLGNPWGEQVRLTCARTHGTDVNTNLYLFEILNDSVRNGTKQVTDPNDFELIDVFGSGDGTNWTIGGFTGDWRAFRNMNFIRKPHIYKGNPEFKGSFGTNEEDSEWLRSGQFYWNTQPIPEKHNNRYIYTCLDLGKHFMDDITEYLSTVNSVVYLVSEGYSQSETIRGVKTGTTAADFLNNIIKANENQTLKLKASPDGSDLTGGATLNMNDTLVVLSADSINITRYILEVSEQGLRSDARLTSGIYKITIESEPKSAGAEKSSGTGTVSGFDYGTTLRTILNNVSVPSGATLLTIDEKGAYVPLKRLNFDTTYVDITVNDKIYLEVIAEDGITSIIYQLLPRSSESDAFVLSDVYEVNHGQQVIQYIPRGTKPAVFLSNLIPSEGASLKLIDKLGNERIDGQIVQDDRLVVTAADGITVRIYYLAMLATQTHPYPTYLAYVVSNIYTVDQAGMFITGPTASTLLSEFYGWITPAIGAEAVVLDNDGLVKTSGDLDDGDKLQVTSADGKVVVIYKLDLDLTLAKNINLQQINIYPNPTTGKLIIAGIEPGNRIRLYNTTGAIIRDYISQGTLEVLSLSDIPSGIFLIVISNDNQLLGSFKAIKR
jgi:hypothetical protein